MSVPKYPPPPVRCAHVQPYFKITNFHQSVLVFFFSNTTVCCSTKYSCIHSKYLLPRILNILPVPYQVQILDFLIFFAFYYLNLLVFFPTFFILERAQAGLLWATGSEPPVGASRPNHSCNKNLVPFGLSGPTWREWLLYYVL